MSTMYTMITKAVPMVKTRPARQQSGFILDKPVLDLLKIDENTRPDHRRQVASDHASARHRRRAKFERRWSRPTEVRQTQTTGQATLATRF